MLNTYIFSTIAILLFTSNLFAQVHHQNDPFKTIEHIVLPNGLQVFLAPSKEASLMDIHLSVGVGTEGEFGETIGVSHLLEHVLFRDKNLSDEMSYLQLIKEAGGSANGGTYDRETTYFGSIPSTKGLWLLETFGKMILKPSFDYNYVQKEKGTIEMERGRPSPIGQTLGINPQDLIYPKHLRLDNFWESEFDYRRPKEYSLLTEQLSTQRLTAAQVQTHYDDFYYAKNMKLFIAGKYDRESILKEINKTWGSLPNTIGKVLPAESSATVKRSPYLRQTIDNQPRVYLGYKIWEATPVEGEVLTSFTSYLAHRMMKEIRNIKGQTYSAHAYNHVYKGFGYVAVNFETPKENFIENLDIAKSYFKEAQEGKVSDEQIKEAINLFLADYNLRGRESQDVMATAKEYALMLEQNGEFTSPYSALASITPEQYNAVLVKHFVPEMKYEYLSRPPFFFHYDKHILYGIALILLFMGLRRVLTQSFSNDKIRWVRKVEYPPLKAAEVFALCAAWFIYLHAQYFIDKLFYSSPMQSHILLSQYLYTVVSVVALVCSAQGIYSFMPRKLMVHDGNLLIKSVSYFSKQIPLNQIEKIETTNPMSYPFPVARWLGSVKYRYFFMSPKIWKDGLLITLKNGKGYFFSVKDPKKAKLELMGLIEQSQAGVRTDIAA